MSILRTNTLQNAAGSLSVPVDTVVQGSAKAWVSFNGQGTVAIRAAFNVSSITDNGVGDFTLNFTTAMTDANFAIAGSCQYTAATNGYGTFLQAPYLGQISTSAVRVLISSPTAGYDPLYAYAAIFR